MKSFRIQSSVIALFATLIATAPTAVKKPTYNTKVYEAESSDQSFTSVVKIVREVRGSWEVLFDAKPGVFTVDENQQAMLVESQKDKTPVLVHFNLDTNHIISVRAVKQKAAAQHPL